MGPAGPQGPEGAAATSRNAMRYRAGEQTVAPGDALALDIAEIHADGSISTAGTTGLALAPGQYLLGFVADAARTDAGELGAVLALNGAPLLYTATSVAAGEDAAVRLALTSLLTLTASGTVTVLNSSDGELRYRDPVLTAVRLG